MSMPASMQVPKAVITALNGAQRPVLLAGHGVRLGNAVEEFRRLYELLDIPVATTWPVLDVIPSSHPLCVGKPGAVAQRAPNFVIQNSDFLLSIGTRLDNSITAFNIDKFGRNARRFVVDIDRAELAKFDPQTCTIEADARDFINALLRNAALRSSRARVPAGSSSALNGNAAIRSARAPLCQAQE